MKLYRLVITALSLLVALPLAAQYRDDQFKRDAFTQTYADTTQKATTDSSALFSFKEFFGGLAGKNKASLKTLTIGSAVFIGSNQIYNRQYWKLPIVYGGIGAGIYGGIRCNQLYKSTQDSKYQTFSILSFVGAGLFYWGSLMDGAIMFKSDPMPREMKGTMAYLGVDFFHKLLYGHLIGDVADIAVDIGDAGLLVVCQTALQGCLIDIIENDVLNTCGYKSLCNVESNTVRSTGNPGIFAFKRKDISHNIKC